MRKDTKHDHSFIYSFSPAIKFFCLIYAIFFLILVYAGRLALEKSSGTNVSLYALLEENRVKVFVIVFLAAFVSLFWYEILDFATAVGGGIFVILKFLVWLFIGIFMWKKMGIELQHLIAGNLKVTKDVYLSAYVLNPNNLWKEMSRLCIYATLLKNVKKFLRNKSASQMAFNLDIIYNLYVACGIAFYFNFPFSNWAYMTPNRWLIFFGTAPLAVFIFMFANYMRYSSIMDGEMADNFMQITLVLMDSPFSCISSYTPWSMMIDNDAAATVKNSNYKVTACRIEEITKCEDWSKNILIFLIDPTGLLYYGNKFYEYMEFARSHSAFMIYEYRYDTELMGNRAQMYELYCKQTDDRDLFYLEPSVGSMRKAAYHLEYIDYVSGTLMTLAPAITQW